LNVIALFFIGQENLVVSEEFVREVANAATLFENLDTLVGG
jgi:hypothetical protein